MLNTIKSRLFISYLSKNIFWHKGQSVFCPAILVSPYPRSRAPRPLGGRASATSRPPFLLLLFRCFPLSLLHSCRAWEKQNLAVGRSVGPTSYQSPDASSLTFLFPPEYALVAKPPSFPLSTPSPFSFPLLPTRDECDSYSTLDGHFASFPFPFFLLLR